MKNSTYVQSLKAQVFILKTELKFSSGYLYNTDLQVRCSVLHRMIDEVEAEIKRAENEELN